MYSVNFYTHGFQSGPYHFVKLHQQEVLAANWACERESQSDLHALILSHSDHYTSFAKNLRLGSLSNSSLRLGSLSNSSPRLGSLSNSSLISMPLAIHLPHVVSPNNQIMNICPRNKTMQSNNQILRNELK